MPYMCGWVCLTVRFWTAEHLQVAIIFRLTPLSLSLCLGLSKRGFVPRLIGTPRVCVAAQVCVSAVDQVGHSRRVGGHQVAQQVAAGNQAHCARHAGGVRRRVERLCRGVVATVGLWGGGVGELDE